MFFFFSSTMNLMCFLFISIIMVSLSRDGKDVRHVHAAAASSSLQHVDEDLKEPSEPRQSRHRAKEEELFSGTNIFPGTNIVPGANIFSSTNIFPVANIFSWYKRDPLAKRKPLQKNRYGDNCLNISYEN